MMQMYTKILNKQTFFVIFSTIFFVDYKNICIFAS